MYAGVLDRLKTTELAAATAIIIVILALVALIWLVTIRTMQEQRAEVGD